MSFAVCLTGWLALMTSIPGIETMPDGVFIECEEFTLAGKWQHDNGNYAGYSGQGYIIEKASSDIAGYAPTKDVTLPRSGRYHVWVRACLGGTPAKIMYDREFSVEVNGTMLDATHRGIAGNGFQWELCGRLDVGANCSARIRLHDRGRSPAIIDCLLLTQDDQFKPTDWIGNSHRPGMSIPFQPPKTIVKDAKPYQLTKAPEEHIEILNDSGSYLVNMGGTLDEFNTVQYLDTYSSYKRLSCKFQPNRYVLIENVGTHDVMNPRLIINGRRNWFSVKDMLDGILKPRMNDAEKAMAIWRFTSSIEVQCHENNRRVGPLYPDSRSHPSRNTFCERANPVKAVNCYYCSGCQLSASNCVVLMHQAGLTARAVWKCPQGQFENHCVVEAWHDGAWHLYDPEAKSFYLESDNTTVASYETLHNQPELAARTHIRGFTSPPTTTTSHAKGYRQYFPPSAMPVEQDWVSTMAMRLRPGETFIWRWKDDDKFRCGLNPRNRNYPPYRLANGKLIYKPDLSKPISLNGILSANNIKSTIEDGKQPKLHPITPHDPASVIYKLSTPYPIVGGVVGGTFYRKNANDRCKIYLSIANSDWHEVWSADKTGHFRQYVSLDDVMGFKTGPARYTCYVKYEFATGSEVTDVGIDAVYMELDVQMSASALPSLSVGSNNVVYCDETTEDRKVRIVHGWEESSATHPPHSPVRPVSPVNGTSVTLESLAKLVWEPAKDPDSQPIVNYHVQVSTRKDVLYPLSPNFDRLTFSGEPEWESPQGWFVRGRTYYWRVRATDQWGASSDWSDVWQFTIR